MIFLIFLIFVIFVIFVMRARRALGGPRQVLTNADPATVPAHALCFVHHAAISTETETTTRKSTRIAAEVPEN